MQSQPLETIGLGGDGDEVDAVTAVEKHFAVSLDYGDAPGWRSAGDVFASLLKVLPPEQRERPDLWRTFATLLCRETGADASRVTPDTLLLGLPLKTYVGRWLRDPLRPQLTSAMVESVR